MNIANILYILPNKILSFLVHFLPQCDLRYLIEVVLYSKKNAQHRFVRCKHKKSITFVSTFGYDFWGMMDRFKGIISVFSFCQQQQFNYRILHEKPYVLEKYVIPVSYNWILSDVEKKEIEDDCGVFECFLINNMGEKSDKRVWQASQFTLNQIAKMRGVKYVLVHTNVSFGTPRMQEFFRALFQPSPIVAQNIQYWQRQVNSIYSTVSFRFVNLLGDSDEKVEGIEKLSMENQSHLMDCCVYELKKIVEKEKLPVFVTTDSPRYLNYLKKYQIQGVYYIESKYNITHHIGYGGNVCEEQILKSFTELYMIMGAKNAYQINMPPMYASNFPKWAACIGGVPYELVRLPALN